VIFPPIILNLFFNLLSFEKDIQLLIGYKFSLWTTEAVFGFVTYITIYLKYILTPFSETEKAYTILHCVRNKTSLIMRNDITNISAEYTLLVPEELDFDSDDILLPVICERTTLPDIRIKRRSYQPLSHSRQSQCYKVRCWLYALLQLTAFRPCEGLPQTALKMSLVRGWPSPPTVSGDG
jgi:hypothetical protein